MKRKNEATEPGPFRCTRCGQDRLGDEFYWPGGKRNVWCRPCYREWHRQRYAAASDDSPRTCTHCGTVYVPPTRKASEFCSRTCKDRVKNARRAAINVATKPTDRRCAWCGGGMPQTMRSDAAYCSADCNSAAHRTHRNWARRMGSRAPVKPRHDPLPSFIDIAERDRWTCALCGQPVDPALRFPDLMRGSLDHILPLAMGGSNDEDNLQLSHLICNLRKGAAAA